MSVVSAEPPRWAIAALSSCAVAGHVEPDDVALRRATAPARSRRPIPRAAPVTSATLPSRGRSQSIWLGGVEVTAPGRSGPPGRRRTPTAARGRSAASTRARQRRLERVFACRAHVQQLRGGATSDLLADRAHEPLERPLGDRLRRRGAVLGRRAEHDHPTTAEHPADRRVQKGPRLRELLACLDPGGVEHERLEALLIGCGLRIPDPGAQLGVGRRGAQVLVHRRQHVGADSREHGGERGAPAASRAPCPSSDRAGNDRLAGLVALEL